MLISLDQGSPNLATLRLVDFNSKNSGKYRIQKQLPSYTSFCNLCVVQPKFYKSVIDDVIEGVRDVFVEEGVDEQILKELKRVSAVARKAFVQLHLVHQLHLS
uniref:Uncharacterized protein n=1 Tax=Pseudonaja textilis TaxID=8673 RepID=A0A670YSH9_PSETE